MRNRMLMPVYSERDRLQAQVAEKQSQIEQLSSRISEVEKFESYKAERAAYELEVEKERDEMRRQNNIMREALVSIRDSEPTTIRFHRVLSDIARQALEVI